MAAASAHNTSAVAERTLPHMSDATRVETWAFARERHSLPSYNVGQHDDGNNHKCISYVCT